MFNVTCRVCNQAMRIVVDQDALCPSCTRLGQALQDILPIPPVKRFCIHYALRHTGWVEVVDEDKVKIANIPSCTGLNLGDVVTLKKPYQCCDRPVADKLVARQYRRKIAVYYFEAEHFRTLSRALEAAGAPCEGWTGADGRRMGTMGVAYNDDVDVQAVLDGTGLPYRFEPIELGRRRSS